MRRVFRRPEFRRLFAGVGWTLTGDSLLLLMLSIWVKDLTGSSAAAGLTFFWIVLPTLFAPLLGWIVDQFPRRGFLVYGNLASTLTIAPLLLVDEADHVWLLYACAFGYGIAFVMLPAALNGMLKLILSQDELVDGNGAVGTAKEALRIAGPIAGAAIYTVLGPHAVVALNIGAYVLAAAVIATMRVASDRVEPTQLSAKQALLVGIRHVRDDPILFHPLIGVGLALIVFGFTESAVYVVIDTFHKPAAYAGVIVAAQGSGAVIGGLLAAHIIRRISEVRAITVSLGLFVLGTAGIALAPTMGAVLAAVIPTGFGLVLMIVALMTLLQRRTPAAIIGRVSTAFDIILGLPQIVSIAVGAMLVTVLDFRWIFGLMAVICAIAAVYVSRLGIRKPGRAAVEAGDPVNEASQLM